jgi:hypothetical protein
VRSPSITVIVALQCATALHATGIRNASAQGGPTERIASSGPLLQLLEHKVSGNRGPKAAKGVIYFIRGKGKVPSLDSFQLGPLYVVRTFRTVGSLI